jgi:hypothetical protein
MENKQEILSKLTKELRSENDKLKINFADLIYRIKKQYEQKE